MYSKNPDTGEKSLKPVTHLFEKQRPIYELQVKAKGGKTKLIETTDDHPFFVVNKGWVTAAKLVAGDRIESKKKKVVSVVTGKQTERIATTYNLEVADFHTYYATEFGLLVHNACKFPDAKELAKMLGTNKDTFHVQTKQEIKKDHGDEMKKIGTTNPDIGITSDGNIAFKNPKTKAVIETTTPLDSYSR